MPILGSIGLGLAALVGLLHVYIFVLEAFLWTTPRGRRVFQMDEAKAETTRVLAQNQGLYNLFLAAGIFWGLASGPELLARTSFFLGCVAVAGVVGAATAVRRILYFQTVPAVAALLALWLGR
jgi:putative membrane protein